MRNVLFTLFLCLPLWGMAQTYHPIIESNKYWELGIYGGQPCYQNMGRYFFQGDTTINNQTYQKLYYHKAIDTISNPFGILCPPFTLDTNTFLMEYAFREDTINQQVFIYDYQNNTEGLIYDFSLQTGDTLNTYWGQQHYIYSIDTILLQNGTQRRRFVLNDYSDYPHYIEGIGGWQGITNPLVAGLGFGTDIFCINTNGVNLYGNDCFASFFVQTNEALHIDLKIYPNPTTNFLQIELEKPLEDGQYQIFNALGQIVQQGVITAKNFSIAVEEFAKGTYWLKIIDKERFMVRSFLKN